MAEVQVEIVSALKNKTNGFCTNGHVNGAVVNGLVNGVSNGAVNGAIVNNGTTNGSCVREQMKQYWKQFQASEESMMLCSAANDILASEDRQQILAVCPNLVGKDVLELGAGIGRFTTELSKIAKSVTAVDFMESYTEENQKRNGHFINTKFIAGDVTELQLENQKYDVIFSNWLLMYISDHELERLVVKMLRWLKPNGYLFVRESCYRQSGDKKRVGNPTFYRSPLEYFKILQHTASPKSSNKQFAFVCEKALSIEAYIRHYGNPFQLGFILKKMAKAPDSYDSFQAFLDGNQYTEEGIKRYEFIFGKTYVSTGGKDTTEKFVKTLDLKPNSYVLDVGCGIGGSAFFMAETYGAKVHGVDLSSNMISMAIKYQGEMDEKIRKNVTFEMSDITKDYFQPNTFDVIYSRDTILHIGDKEALFTKFFDWLKPGGKLLITDYCHGDKENHSEAYLKYVLQRCYLMLTVPEYAQLLEKVGFTNVAGQNRTKQFMEILHTELDRFNVQKQEFLNQFTEADFNYIAGGWQAKLERCGTGDQAWGLFTAVKP